MSGGQYRVLVLLLVLLGLEILRSGPVRSFFTGLFSGFTNTGTTTGTETFGAAKRVNVSPPVKEAQHL